MDTDGELEYVGFWPRVGAMLIDTLLTFLLTTPLLFMLYGRQYYAMPGFLQGPWDFVVSYLLPAAVVIGCWEKWGATPGKMAIGAKIVDAGTGEAPELSQLIGRYIGYFLASIPLLLGLIWVGFDRKKQGWHDMFAGTVVVRAKHRNPEPVRFES